MKRINYGPVEYDQTDAQKRSEFLVLCRNTLDLECYRPELLPVVRSFEAELWLDWYTNVDGYWYDHDIDVWTDWPATID